MKPNVKLAIFVMAFAVVAGSQILRASTCTCNEAPSATTQATYKVVSYSPHSVSISTPPYACESWFDGMPAGITIYQLGSNTPISLPRGGELSGCYSVGSGHNLN